MSRSTVVYIVMIVVCAGGLWAILRSGYSLRAPVDLGGVWTIGSEDPAVIDTLGESVRIDQSGRFVRLNFERGLTVDVKLKSNNVSDESTAKTFDIYFESDDWKVTALGGSARGPLLFQLVGPQKHTFTATRHGIEPESEGIPVEAVTEATVETVETGSDAP